MATDQDLVFVPISVSISYFFYVVFVFIASGKHTLQHTGRLWWRRLLSFLDLS